MRKLLRYKLIAPGKIVAEDISIPKPSDNEVLIKVKACGICGTDIHAFHGKHPFIPPPIVLGHEFSGVEVESGRRVVAEPSVVCGKCYNCRNGRYNICNELKVLGCQIDGAFSEYITIQKDKIFEIPEVISFEEATLIEPTAVAVHGVKKAYPVKNERVFIFGAGPIGLLTLQVLKAYDARQLIVADISQFRLELAKELGAHHVINPMKANVAKWVHEKFGRDGIDKVFECVGGSQESTINQSIELARKGAKILILGVFQGKIPVNMALVQDWEMELLGSLMYTREDFLESIKLMQERKINAKRLVSKVLPMEKISEAFTLIEKEREKMVKIVLNF